MSTKVTLQDLSISNFDQPFDVDHIKGGAPKIYNRSGELCLIYGGPVYILGIRIGYQLVWVSCRSIGAAGGYGGVKVGGW